MALARGVLFVDEGGCLRMDPGDGESFTPIWRSGMKPETRGGRVVVLDKKGDVLAREGELVEMGGGGAPKNLDGTPAVGERTARELRERCPGDYWLVGMGVNMPKEKTVG